MRRAAFAAAGTALVLFACWRTAAPPSTWKWGIPVYPHASLAGSTNAAASFVLYHTSDAVDVVDGWYARYLPARAQHVYDKARQESTFAIFDDTESRTVHIQREDAVTTILVTKVEEARPRPTRR